MLSLVLRFMYQVWETKRFIARALVEGVSYLSRHKDYVSGTILEMQESLASGEVINPEQLEEFIDSHSRFLQVAHSEAQMYGHQGEPEMIAILREIEHQKSQLRDVEELNRDLLGEYPGNPYSLPFRDFTGSRMWMG